MLRLLSALSALEEVVDRPHRDLWGLGDAGRCRERADLIVREILERLRGLPRVDDIQATFAIVRADVEDPGGRPAAGQR